MTNSVDLSVARVSSVKFFMYTQLRQQLEFMSQNSINVTALANEDGLADIYTEIDGVKFIAVDIPRTIHLFRDIKVVFALYRIFKRNNFDIVHSTTPKGGLVCSIASKLAGVKVRLHTFTGQSWVTKTGFKRKLLMYAERLVAKLCTRCYADSESQRQFLIDNNILSPDSITVLGKGSIAGVDVQRFEPSNYSDTDRAILRDTLGVPKNGFLILFVGRVTEDKGIKELIAAFNVLIGRNLDAYLLFVGPLEADGHEFLANLHNPVIKKRIISVGYSDVPEKYMCSSDVLCLPSYREGFGTVVIEAAVTGLPAVGSNIYGLSDSIVAGETGLLVPPRDSIKLADALERLAMSPDFRSYLAKNARARALQNFSSDYVNSLVVDEYRNVMDDLR